MKESDVSIVTSEVQEPKDSLVKDENQAEASKKLGAPIAEEEDKVSSEKEHGTNEVPEENPEVIEAAKVSDEGEMAEPDIMEKAPVEAAIQKPSPTASPIRLKPLGTLYGASVLCGACGALIAIVLSMGGFLQSPVDQFSLWMLAGGFYEGDLVSIGQKIELAIATAAAFCISFFVLDSNRFWRHFLLLLLSFPLIIGSTISLALWGMLFVPFSLAIAVLGAWIAASFYASHHVMPCSPDYLARKSAKARAKAGMAVHALPDQLEEDKGSMKTKQPPLLAENSQEEIVAEKEDLLPLNSGDDTEVRPSADAIESQEKDSKTKAEAGPSVPKPRIGKAQKSLDTMKVTVKSKLKSDLAEASEPADTDDSNDLKAPKENKQAVGVDVMNG